MAVCFLNYQLVKNYVFDVDESGNTSDKFL